MGIIVKKLEIDKKNLAYVDTQDRRLNVEFPLPFVPNVPRMWNIISFLVDSDEEDFRWKAAPVLYRCMVLFSNIRKTRAITAIKNDEVDTRNKKYSFIYRVKKYRFDISIVS